MFEYVVSKASMKMLGTIEDKDRCIMKPIETFYRLGHDFW